MAVFRGKQMTSLAGGKTTAPGFVSGTVRCFIEEIELAAQTPSDTIEVARLPKGAVPLYGVISASETLGTATISIGTADAPAKYRATGVHTTTAPVLFGTNAGIGQALTEEETILITIGTANLPASGMLCVMFLYAFD